MKSKSCVKNQTKLLMIYRLLTPENRAELLSRVHLAYTEETSVCMPSGSDLAVSGASTLKSREYSCGNIAQRRKK
jgi:hypothetical protein